MIIQCPSCSTKFAVDEGQLADVDNPRFHCSRCDHFFEAIESRSSGKTDDPGTDAESPRSASTLPESDVPVTGPDAEQSEQSIQLNLLGEAESALQTGDEPVDAGLGIDDLPFREDPAPRDIPVGVGRLARRETAAPESTRASEPPPAPPRRLGISPGFDLESNPVVFAAWPETGGDKMFEADLRAVHSRLVQLPDSESERSAKLDAELDAELDTKLDDDFDADLEREIDSRPVEIDTLGGGAGTELPTAEQWEMADEDEPEAPRPSFLAGRRSATPFSATPFSRPASSNYPSSSPANICAPAASAAQAIPSIVPPVPSASISVPDEPAFSDDDYRSKDMGARPEDIWRESRRPSASVAREKRNQRVVRWSLPIATSVPLLMTLCVWWWSTHLSKTPQVLRNFLYLEPSGLPQLAPAGLEVTDLTSSFVTLDDGSRVLEIRGSILNASTKTFGKVKLEAKIFDEKNNELGRLIVDPRAGLAEAKIQALSARALTDLQNENGNAFVRLNPNEKVPFRVVFTGVGTADAPANIQWFSARIYSIEPLAS